MRALDGRFVTLKRWLSTRGERWTETYRPFRFRADSDWAVPALAEVGVDWTNLANNHLMDFGETAHLGISDRDEALEVMTAQLARARETDPDLLVVSLCWGPNMVEEPPDRFREFGRWLAERADLIHGHSAHVFQGVKVHEGTPILYDCGDFVDDYAVDSDVRNDRSFLFDTEFEVDDDELVLRL